MSAGSLFCAYRTRDWAHDDQSGMTCPISAVTLDGGTLQGAGLLRFVIVSVTSCEAGRTNERAASCWAARHDPSIASRVSWWHDGASVDHENEGRQGQIASRGFGNKTETRESSKLDFRRAAETRQLATSGESWRWAGLYAAMKHSGEGRRRCRAVEWWPWASCRFRGFLRLGSDQPPSFYRTKGYCRLSVR